MFYVTVGFGLARRYLNTTLPVTLKNLNLILDISSFLYVNHVNFFFVLNFLCEFFFFYQLRKIKLTLSFISISFLRKERSKPHAEVRRLSLGILKVRHCKWKCYACHIYDLDINIKTLHEPNTKLRAHSQIPVLGLTGRALGWPGALKLPSAAVQQTYKYYRPERQCMTCVIYL